MRLGVFGGSFDPPHVGHFLAAVDAAEQLALDRLLWIPTGQQPLKAATPHGASPEHRYAMVAAAAASHPLFTPSRIEIDRNGLSYTVTTLEALEREYPAAERFLLVGEDTWEQFADWKEPERIRTLVQIAVFVRPRPGETQQEGGEEGGDAATSSMRSEVPPLLPPDRRLTTRLLEVSATEIRARVKSGKPIRGFVQDAVADIIESEGLYRW